MTSLDSYFDFPSLAGKPDCAPFEVYALRYATRTGTRNDYFLERDPHDGPATLDYYVWLARSPDRTILIDTGFSRESAERRRRDMLRCPIDSLKLLGVEPSELRDVVLTHLHFDHSGNLDMLPNATIHLQDAEMAFATGRYMRFSCCGGPYELEDVVRLLRLNYAGRIAFHDGAGELCPGVSLHRVGGHSAGQQFVRIWTRKGWLVVASDASHFYENFETYRPFFLNVHVGQALDGYTALRRLASAPEMIVPGHDPLVMERFPPAREDLAGIAVRLD
ncbi:N-acyl homoserine lactonase family protein [Bosea sp. (in: a-proteobacteria)]|uniref:N-acyl homoserine lactonase family protein n=1 Tax=Bosea sp. (in: a-proteobacteria) TaxID=1871050 RepID=UPI002632D23B|nr:N-acyl homoserine lactonase family protein [Bosea sp. (in: a-proteobacteria)]MCO5090174.1 N-acyl homoserine lactonase family protein [Bosea sp. (in: a-proteobacteria)]